MTTNCSHETGAPAAPKGSRLSLPMLGHTRGSRSAQTCHFRCGDACLTESRSASTALPFEHLAQQAIARRSVLAGLGAAVVAGGALSPQDARAAGRGSRAAAAASAPGAMAPAGMMAGFAPVGPIPADVDDLVVPEGWDWHSIIAWGDPVELGAPEFDLDDQTAEAQLTQFGYNVDYLTVVPLGGSGKRALLVVNHEYTNENIMFPGYTDDESLTLEQRMISMAAHGMSVVEVGRAGVESPWKVVPSRYNRRITASTTQFRLTGPVAGSELVRTSADPDGTTVIGTLNNCAGGTTPWGTVLSGEENFQGYFRNTSTPDERNAVYGISDTGRGWDLVDERFDLTHEPHEVNRFGWIVEVNPYDPSSTPRKHTAMGRFRHEGATPSIAPDGRVVCYMGDDTGGQHLYKFVSRDRVARNPRQGRDHDVLEHGDLYVAKLSVDGEPSSDYDGTGEWVPLTMDGRSMVPGQSLEEVLTFTRSAAAAVGATPMDRPEDVERNPVTGRVYMACTNNTGRAEPGAANPRAANRYGHIVEITEDGDDQTATTFTWALPVVCGDPSDPSTYFSGLPASEVMPIACPDNVAFDSQGGLWVSTDGQPGSLDLNDALHHVATEGPDRGKVRTFLPCRSARRPAGRWSTWTRAWSWCASSTRARSTARASRTRCRATPTTARCASRARAWPRRSSGAETVLREDEHAGRPGDDARVVTGPLYRRGMTHDDAEALAGHGHGAPPPTPGTSPAGREEAEGGSASAVADLTPEELAFLHGVFDAAREGRADELAEVVDKGVPVDLTNSSGDTLLVLAAYHQQHDAVRVLLERGADVERTNDRGQSALAAAVFRQDEQVVRTLLGAGAEPDRGPRSAVETARVFELPAMLELLQDPTLRP